MRSPLARLPTTSVAWKRNSSSVVHSATLLRVSVKSPEPLPLAWPLLRFPPLRASARSRSTTGLTMPCVTASSLRCSWPTISFLRLWRAATCASGVLGFESSMSAGGMEERPMAQMGAEVSSLRGCYNGLARFKRLHNLISTGGGSGEWPGYWRKQYCQGTAQAREVRAMDVPDVAGRRPQAS